jgi:hypothetical protein
LAQAMWTMAFVTDTRTMGMRAREYSEGKTFSAAFEQLWQLFAA